MWDTELINPLYVRNEKPRISGITMIMDKGIGTRLFKDFLEVGTPYIDFIKLGFGTSGITPVPVLKEKIRLARNAHISIYPGGTFFEIAKIQDRVQSYFKTLIRFGFEWVEISDGTITLSPEERKSAIYQARDHGLKVITEVGKKNEHVPTTLDELQYLYEQDRSHGSSYVIVEGRESGQNLSVFNEKGQLDLHYIHEIIKSIGSSHLIWEAPQKKQQVQLLNTIGPSVNFGNIPPSEILSVEALRRGLRADTVFPKN